MTFSVEPGLIEIKKNNERKCKIIKNNYKDKDTTYLLLKRAMFPVNCYKPGPWIFFPWHVLKYI